MKKFTHGLFLLLLLSAAGKVRAQAPEQDCFNGIPVCQPTYSQANSYSGQGTVEELDNQNQGCLGAGEKNGVWYIINVSSSGLLEFTITPNDLSDDYDFGLWDITGVGCGGIFNYGAGTTNAFPPIRCNFSGTPGQTGISNTITGSQWDVGLNVTAGQTLALYVSNYEDLTQNGYTLDFTPSSASIFDNVPPSFANAVVFCGTVSNHIDITMSEPIKCSTLAADGSDFALSPLPPGYSITGASSTLCSGGGSSTITYTIQFSGVLPPGNYTITAQNGTDGNTLEDNCGNFQVVGDVVNFTMNPATPPKIVSVDTPACISTRLLLDRGISCATVAADGSDFQITGPGGAVNVVKAVPVGCNSSNMTDTIDLYFDKSIYVPGTYTINVVTGSDGNPVTDTCHLGIVDPATFVVSDQGGVIASATPNLLCEQGYVQLNAQTITPPPPVALNCGTHIGAVTGTSTPYQIGTGTTGTINYTPFYGAYEDARTQMLYSAAELQAAGISSGTITQLLLNITAKNSSLAYNNFSIKMGCTSATDLTNGFVSGLSQVYGPTTYNAVQGNNTFVLTTPYDWDGVSNLVVEICFDNNNSSSSDYVQYTATTGNTVYNRHQFGGSGCAMTSTTGTGGASANRANINFSVIPAQAVGYGYLWKPSSFVGDSTAATTAAFVPHTTTYQVQILDTFRCYRRDTAQVIVSERQPTLGPVNDTAICVGNAAHLYAGGGNSYVWYPSEGLSCTTCDNPVATPTATTTYHVAIFDVYGCSDTLTTTVVVNPLPPLAVTDDTTVIFGTNLQLYATAPSGVYYVWDPIVGLNNPNIPNPVATPQMTTTYTVLVIDTNQCRSTDSVKVTVDIDQPLLVPSAFTPNGDGKNDVFRVANLTFQKVQEFRVFNRWGQEVFNGLDNMKGWDGTYKGIVQDAGVYQYVIKVVHPDGRSETFKGDVTLVR